MYLVFSEMFMKTRKSEQQSIAEKKYQDKSVNQAQTVYFTRTSGNYCYVSTYSLYYTTTLKTKLRSYLRLGCVVLA